MNAISVCALKARKPPECIWGAFRSAASKSGSECGFGSKHASFHAEKLTTHQVDDQLQLKQQQQQQHDDDDSIGKVSTDSHVSH